jgi:hypothetical protein
MDHQNPTEQISIFTNVRLGSLPTKGFPISHASPQVMISSVSWQHHHSVMVLFGEHLRSCIVRFKNYLEYDDSINWGIAC